MFAERWWLGVVAFMRAKLSVQNQIGIFCAGIMILARTFYLKKHTSIWSNSQIENICWYVVIVYGYFLPMSMFRTLDQEILWKYSDIY